MQFDPDEYLASSPEGDFDPDAYLSEPAQNTSLASKANSALRGSSQGVSMGFDDEIAGALSVAGRPFGIKGLGGKLSDIEFASPTLDADEIMGEYDRVRDAERANNAIAEKENPNTYFGSQIAGGVGGSLLVPGLNAAKGAGLMATAGKAGLQGALTGAGMSEADNLGGLAKDVGFGAGLGVLAGTGAYGAGKAIEKASPLFKSLLEKLGTKSKDVAEELAVKATGATGKQTEKFADDAGRELLDRGLVKFGDSAEGIAGRVGTEMDRASGNISKAISGLDEKGATASVDDIVAGLESKIAEYSKDPSKAPLVKKLESIILDITETGESRIPLSRAEEIKRGFGSKIKNWLDPEAGAANKDAYRGYMSEVEKSALNADESLSGVFQEGKKTYGLLAPIEEAATKRAAQLNQSPFGGLGDIAATAAGGGNPLYAGARRMVAPRLASSAAVGMDKIGDMLQASPQLFGKYANVLQQAAQRGPQGLASTHFILQNSDKNYRMILDQVAGNDQSGDKDDFNRELGN